MSPGSSWPKHLKDYKTKHPNQAKGTVLLVADNQKNRPLGLSKKTIALNIHLCCNVLVLHNKGGGRYVKKRPEQSAVV